MTELTKEEKKVIRKAKFKKILKIAGICLGASAGIAAASGKICYEIGKKKAFESPEYELLVNMHAYDAMEELGERQLDYASRGDYATEFTNDATGEKKYLIFTASDTAPDWWNAEDTRHFDIKEEILGENTNA